MGNTMKNIAIDGADSSSYIIVYEQIVGIVDSVVDEFVSLSTRVAMSNDIPFAYKSIRKVGEK